MTAPRRTANRLSPALFPIFLVGLALPLLAPTCGDFQPGVKTFSKGSLIIPMDVCYQCTLDALTSTSPAACGQAGYATPSGPGMAGGRACPQATAPGDVIRAYGLVYQLIRNDVAVYWVIDPTKQHLDDPDLSIQFNSGLPVQRFDWAASGLGAAPSQSALIRYMGGPFVVDGSDYEKARVVLNRFRADFSAVNVHVSNVAFQGYVSKTMAGGWSAGGTTPPKLALLDIGSGELTARGTQAECTSSTDTTRNCLGSYCISTVKNSEQVIQGYLTRAGIDSAGAGGTTAPGAHGQIYDRLLIEDFQPTTPGDWSTTRLFENQYQILWIPHWTAPGSCKATPYDGAGNIRACACLFNRASDTEIQNVLKSIGAFAAAGRDVFAECAGLGSLEGARAGSDTLRAYPLSYAQGDPTTRFHSTQGMRINDPALDTGQVIGSYASPLLQIGDFQFVADSGAIDEYRPITANGGGYQPGVERLITALDPNGAWDYFTFRPGADGRGTVVYLAGHSYSDNQGDFQAAGSRLVLNTLFNLGAGCTTSGVACDTDQLGVCGRGVLTCGSGGVPVCTTTTTGSAEICNGLDDDCDGLVDEDLELACYDGPAGTQGVGLCAAGVRSCQQNPDGSYGFSACTGEVLPADEVCNGLDDDCNGATDENLQQACYTGPDSTRNPPGTGPPVGACKEGTQTCSNGNWGACAGQVLPAASVCDSVEQSGEATDSNCDGQINTCADCTVGVTPARPCYSGPSGTRGVGLCRAGTQACVGAGAWGTCQDEVLPQPEICNDGIDQDCDGLLDDTAAGGCLSCAAGSTRSCWPGPQTVPSAGGTVPIRFNDFVDPGFSSVLFQAAACRHGSQACSAGEFAACGTGAKPVLPGPEVCNGKDDDCNGAVDDTAVCGGGFACENGVCVPRNCGPEQGCLEGYDCNAAHLCKVASCGTLGRACDPGTLCVNGQCLDPNAGLTCGAGSAPAGGYCTGGACFEVPCPDGSGQICQGGDCVADPCAGALCPDGTFCRQGDCVQSCAFAACGAGQRCDVDGFCVADACAGKTCPPSQVCSDGACVADLCLGVACGRGQVCRPGTCPCEGTECAPGATTKACATCLDDPCIGVACPAGLCRDGQCFPATLAVAGPGDAGGSGCGCGSGAGSPLAFLGLLLAVPLARRRRRGAGKGGAALAAAVLATGLASTGCPKSSEPFDPAACKDPDHASLVACETEARCVDLNFDPSHCGVCGVACGAGNQCVDGVCGPASTVAPRITDVQPATAPRGGLAPQPVVLAGERFQAGATLRVTTPTGTFTVPTTLRQDGRLEAALDLSVVPTGTWSLRVVNPDLVISNARAFGVVFPTPAITKVWPVPDAGGGAVAVGALRRLRLEGTGLMVDSACRVGGGSLPEQEVAAELKAADGAAGLPAGLECEVDLSRVAPGTYDVWAVNDATHVSAKRTFQAVSAPPVLTTLSPSFAVAGTTGVVLDLFGGGFDVTSKVFFRAVDGGASGEREVPATFVDATRLGVTGLDLSSCPVGSGACTETTATRAYFLLVRNGAQASAAVELSLRSSGAVPTVTGLSIGSAYQGDVPTLTITGTNLPAGSVMEARPPGGIFAALPVPPSPPAGATSVSGTLDLTGQLAGSWEIRLRYPAGQGSSSTFPLRVLSNTAVITSTAAPAGGAQGAIVPVTLTVSNINPPSGSASGVQVVFSATPGSPLLPTAPQAGKLAVALPLASLATGVYTLSVVNPNAAPSNAVNFTVSPGPPSLSPPLACVTPGTACVAGTPPSAPQQSAKVPIRITGTNFARPDAAGNNGTSVHVFAGCTPEVNNLNQMACTCFTNPAPPLCVPDHVIPAADVAVDSPTQLTVALDTTAAVPGTYSVWVWNPGGAPSPQRSNTLVNAFQITP